MKIQLDIDRKGRITVPCFFAIPSEGRSGQVVFVIDTGAPVMILNEGDAVRLGIEPENYKRSPKPLLGLGDRAEPHVLNNIFMIFKTDEGPKTEEMNEMIVTKIRERDEKLKKALLSFPSLLGRDFLRDFGYKLFVDLKNNVAFLER